MSIHHCIRRRAIIAAWAVALLIGGSFNATAQQYPSKPVKLVVPYAPGGAVDIFTRLIAKELNSVNGQPYIVENKGGAGGVVAISEVVRSAADGYTILLGATGPNTIVPPVYGPAAGFDPLKDLVPVTLLASMPYVLVVKRTMPVKNVKEFIAYVQKNQATMNYASSGTGGPDHLAGELFKQLAHVDVTHIPYKGSGPALADLAGGRVDYTFTSPLVAMPLAESGKVRVLGMTGPERSALLPGLPAIAETLPGFSLVSWYGFFVPAGTPKAIVQKINADVRKIYASQAFRENLKKRGVQIQSSTPEAFGTFVREELKKWTKVVKDGNISAR